MRTIDLGLGYGIASLFLCGALLENGGSPHHVAIDPHQATRYADLGLQALSDADVAELVEFYREPSELVLPRLLGEGRRFDVAFLDGNHRFDWVFLDLIYLGRLVEPGGVIIVDDVQLPSVQKSVSFVEANLGWRLEAGSTEDPFHHWVVLRTGREPDTREYEHYVDF